MNIPIEHASVSNILCLTAGIVLGFFGGYMRQRREDMADPVNAPHEKRLNIQKWLGGIFVVLAIFIVIQTSATNNAVEDNSEDQLALAEEVRECNAEFQRVLKERASITESDSQISAIERQALSTLIASLAAAQAENDGEAVRNALRQYQGTITDANARRAFNDEQRRSNPYPEPRCGS